MNADRLDTIAAAEYLKVSVSLLTKYRALKKGPRYYKRGGTVFYLAADLDEYLYGRCVETMDSKREAAQ